MTDAYRISAEELARRNVRLSPRGHKVLQYLGQNLDHPTADQIHAALLPQVPTLSKTTVYNTLHALVLAGLVRENTIDDSQIRYDIVTSDHGHLRCVRCGSIVDFAVDFASLGTGDLRGFKVLGKDVYFSGVCPNCLAKTDHVE